MRVVCEVAAGFAAFVLLWCLAAPVATGQRLGMLVTAFGDARCEQHAFLVLPRVRH